MQALGATLIVGLVGTSWQAIRAIEAEKLADSRLTKETESRKSADAERERAIAAEAQTANLLSRAEEQRQFSERQLVVSEKRLEIAVRAVDEMYTQFASEWLSQQAGYFDSSLSQWTDFHNCDLAVKIDKSDFATSESNQAWILRRPNRNVRSPHPRCNKLKLLFSGQPMVTPMNSRVSV